eukprot:Skav204821  [mRNA]  locus=scaffold3914:207947:208210:+ [translate_table: standard]
MERNGKSLKEMERNGKKWQGEKERRREGEKETEEKGKKKGKEKEEGIAWKKGIASSLQRRSGRGLQAADSQWQIGMPFSNSVAFVAR